MTTTISEGTVTPKIAAIRALVDAGYTLIPCNGKIPTIQNWVDTAPGAYGEKELANSNFGVVLRAGDLVVDVDPRNFASGDKPLARLIAAVGALDGTFVVRTGGGGLHIYLRKDPDILVVNGLKEFPGIEFKSAGRQVVGPYSVHPESGKEYQVASGHPNTIAEAPTGLLALIKKTAVPFVEINGGTGAYQNDAQTQGRYSSFLQDTAEPSVEGRGGDENAFKVACRGRDLGLPPATTFDLMLEFWNPRCKPEWDAEELKAKVVHAYRYASGAVGSAHPSAAFDVYPSDVAQPPKKEKDPEIAWDTTAQGVVKRSFINLLNYLRLPAGGLYRIFAYNELAGRVEFVSPAPWHRGIMPRYAGVGDSDLKLLKGYLAQRHGFECSVQHIEEAVTNVAYHERFHPVRAYLEGLTWDGEPRLDFWLRDYLGAVDGGYPEYLRAISRKVLCAAVMRVLRPGVKFDHVLVLEGEQDLGKSTVIEILGGDWASDAPVDPHSRDTVDAMQGRWFIEMAEMEVLRKTDEDALKAFITRKTDRVRLAYGRTTGEFPRQSIFIATKNPRTDGTYLKDDTGNRRWWPVRCEPATDAQGLAQIDFKGLKAARNQLFAEAVARMKMKPKEELFMETASLKLNAKAVVGQRYAPHEWTERIASWLEECDRKPETRREFLTARDVFIDGMGGADSHLDRKSCLAIASVLRTLGWTHVQKWRNNRPVKGYERMDEQVEDPTAELMAGLL